MKKITLFLLFCLAWLHVPAQYQPSESNLQARARFQDNKFGIFIHWGLYSMLGDGEWVMHNKNINYEEYTHLAAGFYPSKFNAEEWVKAIKDAGARYITITSRHHDGFSMFKTDASSYNIVDATPYKQDVLQQLSAACQRHGITLNFYYSHLDWQRLDYPVGRTGQGVGRPTGQQDYNSYFNFMNKQLTELLTNYGEIGAIWFDGWWDHEEDKTPFDWRLDEQYALIHKLQPACLIGNNHHNAVMPGEDIQMFERDLPGENKAGLSANSKRGNLPLETCATMNRRWGYDITDHAYRSAKDLIRQLVGAAGRNANLLLNIGPRPDGQLPGEALERLQQIGEWMRANGETIYGTRGGCIAPHDWGVSTQKGNKLYVHIFELADKSLFVPLEGKKVVKARMFSSQKAIGTVNVDGGIVLELPAPPTGIDTIVELTLK